MKDLCTSITRKITTVNDFPERKTDLAQNDDIMWSKETQNENQDVVSKFREVGRYHLEIGQTSTPSSKGTSSTLHLFGIAFSDRWEI